METIYKELNNLLNNIENVEEINSNSLTKELKNKFKIEENINIKLIKIGTYLVLMKSSSKNKNKQEVIIETDLKSFNSFKKTLPLLNTIGLKTTSYF